MNDLIMKVGMIFDAEHAEITAAAENATSAEWSHLLASANTTMFLRNAVLEVLREELEKDNEDRC